MKIATLQYNIVWEDTSANLQRLSGLLDQLPSDVDILVLPEMFNTGFSMNVNQIALTAGGEALDWMKKTARERQSVVVGSIPVAVQNDIFNRLYWVQPDGKVMHYDKRHLFRMAEEHHHYTAGEKQVVVEYKEFRFMLQVCYDLRFPVWSRNTPELAYDTIIYVANWPAARSEAWYSLLKARAIENLSYVVGVNRVGEDGNEIPYDGKSAVFDYKGTAIDSHVDGEEGFSIQMLDLEALKAFRRKFPAQMDADHFAIK
jgi:predicted amidohydrolase